MNQRKLRVDFCGPCVETEADLMAMIAKVAASAQVPENIFSIVRQKFNRSSVTNQIVGFAVLQIQEGRQDPQHYVKHFSNVPGLTRAQVVTH